MGPREFRRSTFSVAGVSIPRSKFNVIVVPLMLGRKPRPQAGARAIWSPSDSVNHRAPSGPEVIQLGVLYKVGTEYWLIIPAVVIRLTLPPLNSVNHNAPSGPAVMPPGELLGWIGYSVMIPVVVIRPILPLSNSVNHSAPSGPAAMPLGKLRAVRHRICDDDAGGSHPPYLIANIFREPQRAVRASHDAFRPAVCSDGVIRDGAGDSNPTDPAGLVFREPKGTIRSWRYAFRLAGGSWHGILGNDPCQRDLPNLVTRSFREPQRAVRACGDPAGSALCCRHAILGNYAHSGDSCDPS